MDTHSGSANLKSGPRRTAVGDARAALARRNTWLQLTGLLHRHAARALLVTEAILDSTGSPVLDRHGRPVIVHRWKRAREALTHDVETACRLHSEATKLERISPRLAGTMATLVSGVRQPTEVLGPEHYTELYASIDRKTAEVRERDEAARTHRGTGRNPVADE